MITAKTSPPIEALERLRIKCGDRSVAKRAARFWRRVSIRGEQECWPWLGLLNMNGYGATKIGGSYCGAHRAALVFSGVQIPPGMCVCHHCDNRRCCNPKHLYIGTYADNVRDMTKRGREAFGTKNGNAKLSDDSVRAIREMSARGASRQEIADRFGVSKCAVDRIRYGITWRHVQ